MTYKAVVCFTEVFPTHNDVIELDIATGFKTEDEAYAAIRDDMLDHGEDSGLFEWMVVRESG